MFVWMVVSSVRCEGPGPRMVTTEHRHPRTRTRGGAECRCGVLSSLSSDILAQFPSLVPSSRPAPPAPTIQSWYNDTMHECVLYHCNYTIHTRDYTYLICSLCDGGKRIGWNGKKMKIVLNTLLKLNHSHLTIGIIMIKPLNVKCVKLVLDLSSLVNTIYSVLTKQGIEQLFQLIQWLFEFYLKF